MPMIDPAEYGSDWGEFSFNVVFRRAGRRCECRGVCGRDPAHLAEDGRCRNRHGAKRWRGKPWQRPVILSSAHLDHDPSGRDLTRILACCEACHLALDRQHHAATRRGRRERTLNLLPLF